MPDSLKHRQGGRNPGDSEKGSDEDSDPIAELFQLDTIECTALEKEALVLVTQLLQNVEEYYALRGQIKDVMAQDRVMENRIKDLMDTLIRGLLVEQTFLGKEFTGVATL
ncbi:hypothetical protein H8E65_03830 [Candidatus Bathyarchaeota archaeon]|nr:hypothetical protein [Candidatus Bathyarchaeota archaeon]MBL7080604.1 hypothetical protein [Candidatus Bathyarchaeota archaeon]